MAFPGPGAQIYYNEAGEPLGWDYPSDEPDYDPYEDDRRADYESVLAEEAWERAHDWELEETGEDTDGFANWYSSDKSKWAWSLEEAWHEYLRSR